MKNNISKSEAAKIFSKMGVAALKEKYGNAHFEKMAKASRKKLVNTLTIQQRSQRAQLIRREIKFSHLKPDEYGKAISDYDSKRASKN